MVNTLSRDNLITSVTTDSQNTRKLIRNWIIALLTGATWVVWVNEAFDVSGRLGRFGSDRVSFLNEIIEAQSNTDTAHQNMDSNILYYTRKGVKNEAILNAFSTSLTKLDLIVEAYQSGKISENDILRYILWSSSRIVTEPGIQMVQVVEIDGKMQPENRWEFVTTPIGGSGLWSEFVTDVNNSTTTLYNLTFEKRSEGGWYFVKFSYEGHAYSIFVWFMQRPSPHLAATE